MERKGVRIIIRELKGGRKMADEKKVMNKVFLILGAAPYEKNEVPEIKKYLTDLKKEMFVCCADGGAWLARDLGLNPDILIGDMDSYDGDITSDVDVVKLNPIKNDTDLFASIDYGMEAGYKEFVLLGVTGGRLDHFMGALAALEYAMENKAKATIVDSKNIVYMMKGPDDITLKQEGYTFFSIISMDRIIEGINIKGGKYNVQDYTLDRFSSRCISNEISEKQADISIKKGTCMVIQSR